MSKFVKDKGKDLFFGSLNDKKNLDFFQDYLALSSKKRDLAFSFCIFHELGHLKRKHLSFEKLSEQWKEERLARKYSYQQEWEADLQAAFWQGTVKGAFIFFGLVAKHFGNLEEGKKTHPSIIERLAYLVEKWKEDSPKVKQLPTCFSLVDRFALKVQQEEEALGDFFQGQRLRSSFAQDELERLDLLFKRHRYLQQVRKEREALLKQAS